MKVSVYFNQEMTQYIWSLTSKPIPLQYAKNDIISSECETEQLCWGQFSQYLDQHPTYSPGYKITSHDDICQSLEIGDLSSLHIFQFCDTSGNNACQDFFIAQRGQFSPSVLGLAELWFYESPDSMSCYYFSCNRIPASKGSIERKTSQAIWIIVTNG